MCLAIPARVESITEGVAQCRVGQSSTFITASLLLLEEPPTLGDYLIVHAGFAIRKMDVREAEETLTVLRDLATAYEQEQAKHDKTSNEHA